MMLNNSLISRSYRNEGYRDETENNKQGMNNDNALIKFMSAPKLLLKDIPLHRTSSSISTTSSSSQRKSSGGIKRRNSNHSSPGASSPHKTNGASSRHKAKTTSTAGATCSSTPDEGQRKISGRSKRMNSNHTSSSGASSQHKTTGASSQHKTNTPSQHQTNTTSTTVAICRAARSSPSISTSSSSPKRKNSSGGSSKRRNAHDSSGGASSQQKTTGPSSRRKTYAASASAASATSVTSVTSATSCSAAPTEEEVHSKQQAVEEPVLSSILVIGATGATGLACLNRLSRHEKKPKIHAFCQNKSKLSNFDKSKCESVYEGDATNKKDLGRALRKTKANVVVVCIGNRQRMDKNSEDSYVRTACARALVHVMKKKSFRHVRALVVSRVGTENVVLESSSSNNNSSTSHHNHHRLEEMWKKVFPEIHLTTNHGNNNNNNDAAWKKYVPDNLAFLDYKRNLRCILEDHAGQEDVFLKSIPERITIVRATSLKDRKKATGTVNVFRIQDKPSITSVNNMARLDLVSWIAEEICCGVQLGGRVVNITGTRNLNFFLNMAT